ncbi:CRTAC1 family protein [Saccharopolyspora sp. 5N102]|uniref:CRTAC1 family protein n=1 Tax=Saccharopolyspora sp. 5N102 TaxID=3375155 RepID=UPI003799C415
MTPAENPVKSLRELNPSVDHITTWISSVGAGAALADLDGDALANDACLVDPRSDSVSIHQIDREDASNRPITTLVDDNGISAGAANLPYDGDRQAPMGCRLGDLDGNGWTDVLVYFWGRGPVSFLNHGDWKFEPREVLPDGANLDWYTNTAVFSDLNSDGALDIFIGNYFADDAQLLDRESSKTVAMNDSLSRAVNGGGNYVLLGRPGFPEEHFELVTDAFSEENSRGWTLAAAAADVNGDSLPELYVANDFGPDRFFVNRSSNGTLALENVTGSKRFSGTQSTTLGRDSFKSMGASIADINRDGMHDIYVSTITQEFGLFEGQMLFLGEDQNPQDVPTFRSGGESLGLARTAFSWDNKVGDLNNDGRVELLQATGFVRGEVNRWPEIQELALANDATIANPEVWPDLTRADISGAAPRVVMTPTEDGQYANVAEASGLADTGVMRGLALSDVDGDGDLDWIEANQWADARIIQNNHDGGGAFLGLRILRSTDGAPRAPSEQPRVMDGLRAQHEVGGTAAIGASAAFTTPGGETYRSYVDGGNGHSGQSSTDVHFGLAPDAGQAQTVTLTWRDTAGNVQNAEIEVGPGWNTVVLP